VDGNNLTKDTIEEIKGILLILGVLQQ
ncbi:hypothetical protein LCGC14_2058840, partial [marine sediment metagenome]